VVNVYNLARTRQHKPIHALGSSTGLRYDPAMKTTILPTIALILSLSSPCAADTNNEPENYCKDQASWQQWHELLEKHPQDDALYALYASRRGLCSMVESGRIDLDRATRIFERMHESVIRYREQEGLEQEKGKQAM